MDMSRVHIRGLYYPMNWTWTKWRKLLSSGMYTDKYVSNAKDHYPLLWTWTSTCSKWRIILSSKCPKYFEGQIGRKNQTLSMSKVLSKVNFVRKSYPLNVQVLSRINFVGKLYLPNVQSTFEVKFKGWDYPMNWTRTCPCPIHRIILSSEMDMAKYMSNSKDYIILWLGHGHVRVQFRG